MTDYATQLLQITRDAVTMRTAAECVGRFPLPELATTFMEAANRMPARVGVLHEAYRRARQSLVRFGHVGDLAAAEQCEAANDSLLKALEQMAYLRAQFTVSPDGQIDMSEGARGYLELIDPKGYEA